MTAFRGVVRRLVCFLLWAGSATCLVACAEPRSELPDDVSVIEIGQGRHALTNASVDTVHQAVVATGCSATIVHVDGTDGYALTAGHCYGSNTIRQGDDKDNPDRTYDVLARARHPKWDESPLYDSAMLHFSGADLDTPVIPALPPALDSINAGAAVTLVGYGETQAGDANLRHSVDKSLVGAGPLRLRVNQANGGLCGGDSGGAMLAEVNGGEYLAGVHVYISDTCTQGEGTSLRVSAAYETFIMPFITGSDPALHTCDECTAAAFVGACGDEVLDCIQTPLCGVYEQCLATCSTQSCALLCGVNYPAGKAAYDAIFDCGCETACVEECVGDPSCAPDPLCGVHDDDPRCQSCVESNCCDSMSACAVEPTCYACYFEQSPPASACWDNELFAELQSCMGGACDEVCVVPQEVSTGQGGGVPTSGSGGGGAADNAATGTGAQGANDVGNAASDEEDVGGCAMAQPFRTRSVPVWIVTALLLVVVRRGAVGGATKTSSTRRRHRLRRCGRDPSLLCRRHHR